MRFLAKVTISPQKGNEALRSGALQTTIESAMQRLKPEAAYFFEEDGKRECIFVFNLDVPSLLKPLFPNLDASVEVTSVMNATEFQQGLGEAKRKKPPVEKSDLLADIHPVPATPESQWMHARPLDPEPHPSGLDEPTEKS